MNFRVFENWLSSRIAVKSRLKKVTLCFVMFLMIETRKHSLQEAARFWGMNKYGSIRISQHEFNQ